jgi:hypothetical protein
MAVLWENAFCLVQWNKSYYKVDGCMEKKWDTVIPADLKRLCKWDVYVLLVKKVLNCVL